MGGKAQQVPMPPAIDTSVTDAANKAEAKLASEKTAMIGAKKKGMYGTILTSGKGVEEEANTSGSLLGGKKY